jgi:hypothetical protein
MKQLIYENLKYPQLLLRSTAIACLSIFLIALFDYSIGLGNEKHSISIPLQVGFAAALLAAACLRMKQRLIMLPLALLLLFITHIVNQQDLGFLDIAVTALLAISFIFNDTQSKNIQKIKILLSTSLIAVGVYFIATQLIDRQILSSEILKAAQGKPRFAGMFIFAGIICLLHIIGSKFEHIKLRPSLADAFSLVGPLLVYGLLAINSNDARQHAETLATATQQEIQTLIETRKIQALGISALWSEKDMNSAENQHTHVNGFFALIPELKAVYISTKTATKLSVSTPTIMSERNFLPQQYPLSTPEKPQAN